MSDNRKVGDLKLIVIPVVIGLDYIEELIGRHDQTAVFLNIRKLADLEVTFVDIDVVINTGDRKPGLRRSEAIAVGNGEGEVDVANEVF